MLVMWFALQRQILKLPFTWMYYSKVASMSTSFEGFPENKSWHFLRLLVWLAAYQQLWMHAGSSFSWYSLFTCENTRSTQAVERVDF